MSWDEKKLEDVVLLQRGFDLPANNRIQGNVPVISAGQLQGTHNEARVKGPGFAIGRITNLGQPQWSDVDYWPLNTTLFAKDFKGNSPKWLFYLFKVMDLSGYDSGTVQPALNRNYIAKVPVRVPSIEEQRAIADVLGALDDKIAANQEAVSLIKQLMQALGSSITNSAALGDVADSYRESISSRSMENRCIRIHSIPAFDEGYPEKVEGNTIKSGKYLLEQPSVLISKLNPGTPRIWNANVYDDSDFTVCSTEFIPFRSSDISNAALYAVLLQPDFTAHLAECASGTSNSHQRVKPDDILATQIRDPRLFTSAQLDVLNTIAPLAFEIERENQVLAATRDELLPLLMNGKITVAEAEEAVGGVGVVKQNQQEEGESGV